MSRSLPATSASSRTRVRLIVGDPDSPEERAAAQWLRRVDAFEPVDEGADAEAVDVMWVHASSSAAAEAAGATLDGLGDRSGMGLLFTLGATLLPRACAGATPPPDLVQERIWRHEDDDPGIFGTFSVFPRIRGHMPLRGHPLFAGLGVGCYTWRPAQGERYFAAMRTRATWPDERAIAVERSYIRLEAERATIWDAGPGVLCIGAYLYFAARDAAYRAHVERLAGNALRYAAVREASRAVVARWASSPMRVVEDVGLPVASTLAARTALELPEAGISLGGGVGEVDGLAGGGERGSGRARDALGRPVTLAGRGTLLVGDEGGGVEEVWIHPLRVLRDLRLLVDGREPAARRCTVTPIGVTRELGSATTTLSERQLVPREGRGAVLEWRADGPIDLDLRWSTDLRLMWPYPPGALGSLRWRRESGAATLAVSGETGCDDAAAFLVVPDWAEWAVHDIGVPSGAPEVEWRVSARLGAGDRLRVCMAAGASPADAVAQVERLMDAERLAAARSAALGRLAADGLSVRTADTRVGDAVEWAKYRLDSYRVDAPGIGRSLVAGYWRSTPGWGDGRPGYAWFFGRDSVWTALGSLASGQTAAARDVLAVLGRHQDLSGKILHECSTSGAVHYDAADATPLYLLLAARYHAWTGDSGFLAEQWPRVRAAFVHCLGMDGDGDGLIENTGEGHGWIEFGRLGGGAVTFYNAGIWTAALRELADTAESLGDAAWAAELRARHGVAREALERAFYDPATKTYALNLRRVERGWQRNVAQTAMQAVPLLLEVADARRGAYWLDAAASRDVTSPWGVRMVSRADPQYDPASYHGGAVWPLYTGWASWAAFAAGRSESAARLWMLNVELAYRHERGAWPEVLHGEEERMAGVCPDQAWSTAMAISPLVYGLLGVQPDAPRGRVRLRPQVPAAWTRLEVERLRIGDCDVALAYEREGGLHRFRLCQDRGAVPLRVVLEAALPGERLESARVDGVEARLETRRFGERLLAPLQVVLDAERTVELTTASDGS